MKVKNIKNYDFVGGWGTNSKHNKKSLSILDAHLLRPNEDFNKLPETYVMIQTPFRLLAFVSSYIYL